eukprot:11716313-Ditylum_brightwellii.AAC.1
MVEPTLEQFKPWKKKYIIVKFIQCDNAGENITLQKWSQSKDWKMALEFEHTDRATPQQNNLAELGFDLFANKGHSMMHCAKVFLIATLLNGLGVVEIVRVKKIQFEHF